MTKHEQQSVAVLAARRVMVELTRLLGEYREDIVLVGGWVPDFLMPDQGHVGSTDIDLALDHRALQDPGYTSIRRLLLDGGYRQDDRQPFIYWRRVHIEDVEVDVEVDLLAGEYEGSGGAHRTQKVQDVRARKARGCDLAFEKPVTLILTGEHPSGACDTVTIRVASVVPFLVMKGITLRSRLKGKDAYDIWFCLRNYPGGIAALAAQFRPHLTNGVVNEALDALNEKFASVKDTGPVHVADFLGDQDPEARSIVQQDAYQRVDALLKNLGKRP